MSEVAAVGAIIVREGCLLLVRRAHAPSRGRWSLPGGRVEAGESAQQALVRELAEETGLVVEVGELVGEVIRAGPDGVTFRIHDYRATVVTGAEEAAVGKAAVGRAAVGRAGDDAAALAWVPLAEVGRWPLSAGLAATLRRWQVL